MFLKLKTKERGSMLLEALLSTIILSASITIIIYSMISSLRASKYTADHSVALILTDNKINNLRANKMGFTTYILEVGDRVGSDKK